MTLTASLDRIVAVVPKDKTLEDVARIIDRAPALLEKIAAYLESAPMSKEGNLLYEEIRALLEAA